MTIIVDGHVLVITGLEIVVGLCIDAVWITLVVRWRLRKRRVTDRQ
jgi:multisubunit Na+/H+ antiporter MnhC subunit